MRCWRRPPKSRRSHGFTLVELMIVIVIVILVSAVVIAAVPGLVSDYQVTEGARFLMASLAGARDRAIRANEACGIRLLPDSTVSTFAPFSLGGSFGAILASNRMIDLELAPDLTDSADLGSATFPSASAFWVTGSPPPLPNRPLAEIFPVPLGGVAGQVLVIEQAVFDISQPAAIPNPPTNWFWNVRLGDKVRLAGSGATYTVVGPMTRPNPENFVNIDNSSGVPTFKLSDISQNPVAGWSSIVTPEYLFLVDGLDNNGNGFTDDAFDGVDNNLDGAVDNFAEFAFTGMATTVEVETWQGAQLSMAAQSPPPTVKWTILRRPVPVPSAREVNLPGNIVVDLTTWDSPLRPTGAIAQERSRLPVDPNNGTVDIILNQAGQVVPTTRFSNPASASFSESFFQFWLTDRADLHATSPPTSGESFPLLPMPEQAANYTGSTYLKKDRQLVTLFTRTGQVISNSINNFDAHDFNLPYRDAQQGLREAR